MFLHVANPKPMGIPTEMAGSFNLWIQEGQQYINKSPQMDLLEIHPLEIEKIHLFLAFFALKKTWEMTFGHFF